MQVTLKGSNFGATQGVGTVSFNSPGPNGSIVSWSDTQIVATVPSSGLIAGQIFVNQYYKYTAGLSFTVIPPILTSISPTALSPGMQMTLTGSGFGTAQGTGWVSFGIQGRGSIVSWSNTQVVATVPSTVVSAGTATVVQYYANSNGLGFTVVPPPSITSLSPTSGSAGTLVTITGHNFGTTGTVTFNGTTANPISWTSTSITVPVPASASSGNVVVTISGLASNGVNFTFIPSPSITSLSSTSAPVGASVTITGANFGSTQGTNSVTFNGTAATVTSWSATSIAVTVPPGATTGSVVVNASGVSSNGIAFTVLPTPSITSVSPTSGVVGTSVMILGTNLGSAQGTSAVSFNGTTATATSWSSSSITVAVPSGATTGSVTVTVGGVTSNAISFTVQSGGFVATSGRMEAARYGQTATQLSNGRVLIAGGINSSGVASTAEIYTLASQTFAATANPMNVARWLHTATLLNDGTVLIAGGSELANEETLDSAEIYDPVAGTFTLLPNTLNTARVGHTGTLLSNGQVLIVGGYDPNTGIISDSELYDPIAQVFIDLGDTNTPRFHHTATLLQNGQVLIAGGETDPTPSGAHNSAEIFNPTTWTFTPLAVTMTSAREGHAATLLNDGTVLITGGDLPPTGSLNTAEIYNAAANTFAAVSAAMTSPRIFHASVLLNGGQVLLSGGENDSNGTSVALNTAELYNPTAQTFTATPGSMTTVREHQTATLLNDGTVLEGGGTDGTNTFNTAEIYATSKLTGLASIAISPAAPSVPLGSQQLFVATGTYSGGATQILSSVLWSSSSTSVTTISGDATDSGYMTTIAQGTATITATAAGISGSTNVTVPAPALVSITLTPQTLAMPLGTSQQFDAVGTYSDGSTQDLTSTATWSSSSSSITVSNAGLVTTASLGTSTLQASFGSQSSSTTVTVGAAMLVSLSVIPATGTIAVGQSQQYQASGTYTDGSTQNLTSAVTWYVVPQMSASVNSSGLVTAKGQGNVNVTAVSGNFSGVAILTVGSASLISIAVLPGVTSIPVGTDQQFIAMARYADGSSQDITSSVTWASSNATASSVGATGLASALAGGSTNISASSGSVTGTATLTVTGGTIALNTSRYQHSATLLNNGSVLIAGGTSCPSAGSCAYLNSAELYAPTSGTIKSTGSMAAARTAPAVLLGNGKALVAGGYTCDSSGNCTSLSSVEIYDPVAGTFSSAGNMTVDRYEHTMTLLNNGQVLIAGGETCSSSTSCTALNSAELYNPTTGTFTATGNLRAARFNASAVALSSGEILVAGGFDGTNFLASAELYYPDAGTFSGTLPLHTPRASATATLLDSGIVMVAGGSTCSSPGCPTASSELYNGYFYYPTYPTGNMNVPRFDQTATLLTNGQILFAGGYDSCASSCMSDGTTELFDPVASTFITSQTMSTGRSGHTATLLADGSVLLVGGINNGVTLSSTDLYQPASLALPQLALIVISPSSPLVVPVGSTTVMSATGYDSNSNLLGTLQSVIWSSSSPSVATVSNAVGSAGIVHTLSSGTTTITTTVGTVVASTTVSVTSPLVSITVAPQNPTATMGSAQGLNLTATGTYADGSTMDLTSEVNWASSNSSVAAVFDISGNPAVVVPASPGNATITAAFGTVTGSTTVTVNMPLAPVPPLVTGVSPTTGAPGTQVTITGSGFGPTQGNGAVWLGTAVGAVLSWSDSQVVATVSTGSSSGVAQIQQSNGASNPVVFTINTAAIASISPTSGLPGTQVTISGSGFGGTQASGNAWLGTIPGIVNSWSDTQVVATVAAGAASGSVQVLQNGVMSNGVSFTINLPHIASITPNSGTAGTMVTISGNGFGSSQGTGNVWIGNTYAIVTGWSDGQIVASVGSSAVSGIVKVAQSGTWSNAVTFTVPGNFGGAGGGGTTSVTLVPNVINMLVGGTQSTQALDANGNPITGLTWTSTNTAVATLSTDDPPIITAVAPGNATIAAGNASADVTVAAGSVLPTGTVIWSNPGDGSGVSNIVPAVPSSTGVADVFALNADCNIQAIKADGTVGWTASIGTDPSSGGCNSHVPDFQGGLIVYNSQSIYKLDGMTGLAYPAYTAAASDHNLSKPLVHTDGTIFTMDSFSTTFQSLSGTSTSYSSVVAIDPLSGQPKFSVQMGTSTLTLTYVGPGPNECLDSPLPLPQSGASSYSTSSSTAPTWGMIAGDGYLYAFDAPYQETNSTVVVVYSTFDCKWVTSGTLRQTLSLLRVGTSGDSYETQLADAGESGVDNTSSGTTLSAGSLITNADTGALATYEIDTCSGNCLVTPGGTPNRTQSFYLATTSGPSIASNSQVAMVPEQTSSVQPVLQRADGSYVGTVSSTVGNFMVGFAPTGSTLFTVPNETPQIAMDGGGVIGASGTTYDQDGNVTGQLASLPTQSWRGNSYTDGPVDQVAATPIIASSLWSWLGGSPSGGGSAGRPWYFKLVWQNDFSFVPNSRPDLKTDISSYATAIKTAALDAFKQAYSEFPATAVSVSEGALNGGGDTEAVVRNSQTLVPNTYVCGATPDNNSRYSEIDYLHVQEQTPFALNLKLTTQAAVQKALQQGLLIQAIGRGIGNTAAHETAHQFLHECCDMDSDPNSKSRYNPDPTVPDPNARGAYNAGGCDGSMDQSFWLGYWPSPKIDLYWEDAADKGLHGCLKTGWRQLGSFCDQGQ